MLIFKKIFFVGFNGYILPVVGDIHGGARISLDLFILRFSGSILLVVNGIPVDSEASTVTSLS
jgi:hypothetical protein